MATEPLNAAEMGAKGGAARARNLTSLQRSDAARKAVLARWNRQNHGSAVSAPLCSEITIGTLVIPCAVLEDGNRVLSETGVIKAFGLYRSGAVLRRAQEASEGGAQLPQFVAYKNLKPFIDLELASVLQRPLWYRPITGPSAGTLHKGMRAELLPRVCNIWLKARDADAIRGVRQKIVVASADIISRGLAEVGIIALVDEATGFQEFRTRDALAKILEKFVAKELQGYVRAFPLRYFKSLCRLREIEFHPNMRLPRYFGHLTNDIIYARLAPAILEEIKSKNPVVNGRRKEKNYNWLTPEFGHPKLMQHIGSVCTLMELSDTYGDFKQKLDRIHRVYTPMPLFDELPDED